MSAARAVVSACVALLALAQLALASPPPPPPEALVQSAEAASCGSREKMAPEQVPVTLAPIAPESIGAPFGAHNALSLTWQWGVHVSSADPRVAKITGLFLDGEHGLVATTEDRNWLTLDLEHGSLAGIKTVGVAAMRGAPGRPVAPTPTYLFRLVAFPDQGVIARFATKCGFAAEAVPALDVAGHPAVSAMTTVALAYLGLAGDDGGSVKTAFLLPYSRQTVSLDKQDLPSLPGFRLIALSSPASTVPYPFVLWGSQSGKARLQQIHVVPWDDVRMTNARSEVDDLATLSRVPTAMASAYDQTTGRQWIFLTFDAPEGFDIVGLTLDIVRY